MTSHATWIEFKFLNWTQIFLIEFKFHWIQFKFDQIQIQLSPKPKQLPYLPHGVH